MPRPRSRWLSLLLLASLASVGLSAQPSAQLSGPPGGPLGGFPRPLDGDQLHQLRLAGGELQSLRVPSRAVEPVDVPLRVDGVDVTLRLRPHSLRAPDFRLLVQAPDGSWRAVTPPPPTTVRGEVLGVPGSSVAGALADGRLQATIQLGSGQPLWAIQPLDPSDPAAPLVAGARAADGPDTVNHAIYRADDVVDEGATCAAGDGLGFATPVQAVAPPTAEAGSFKVCEIACDADFEYYQLNGSSVSATELDIEAVINGCEAIYLAGAGVSYQITTVLVRTGEADPYSASDSGALLDEFQAEWNAEHGSIVRDSAHLFTGKDLDGSVIGIAYVGAICSSFFGYGLSESRFTSNLTSRVGLTAHELGHSWGSQHCNGDPDCSIMCSGLGGCSGVLTSFGNLALASIEATKTSASCLADGMAGGGPLVEGVAPAFGREDGGSTVVVSGSGFEDAPSTTVRIDGLEATVVSITPDSLVVLTPPGVAGKQVDLLVSGSGGSTVVEDAFTYEWSIHPGDSAESELGSGDIDRAFFDASAGMLLTAQLKGSGSDGADLVPGLRLIGPGEVELVVAEDDPQSPAGLARFKKQLLPATGSYRLELYGVGASSGAYRLKTSRKHPGALKQTLAVGPTAPLAQFDFDAMAGGTIRLLRLKALPAKGPLASIEGEPSALLPQVVALTGPDGPIDVSEQTKLNGSGKLLTIKHVPLDALGSYQLSVGGASGSVGHAKLILKLKPPKPKKQNHVADASLE